MKVPENARELLESLAREHGALNTGADPAVPLWILTLALRALDYEAASGEVTPEILTHEQERIERMLATAEEDGVDLLLMPDEVVALRRLLNQVRALRAKDAPLLSAAARRKALEEAAAEARQWFNGWDIAAAIRALGRPA